MRIVPGKSQMLGDSIIKNYYNRKSIHVLDSITGLQVAIDAITTTPAIIEENFKSEPGLQLAIEAITTAQASIEEKFNSEAIGDPLGPLEGSEDSFDLIDVSSPSPFLARGGTKGKPSGGGGGSDDGGGGGGVDGGGGASTFPTGVGTYDITLNFIGDNWTEELKSPFLGVKEIFSRHFADIQNDEADQIIGLNGYEWDDITFNLSLPEIDGLFNTLGQAGPVQAVSYSNREGVFVSAAIVELDIADVVYMQDTNTYHEVVVHEMFHGIGFGTLWDYWNVTSQKGRGLRYTGENAIAAYNQENNAAVDYISVETDGGPGTAGGHWDEVIYGTELMTGYTQGLPATLQSMSAASLLDIGLQLNQSGDLFVFTNEINDLLGLG